MADLTHQIGIRITASGADSVGREANAVTAHLDKVGGLVKNVAGMVGAALTVDKFVDWMKAAIDAGDHMKEFSQKTGVAVEEVAGLELAFKQGGVGGEELTKALGKMSKQMVEGNDAFDKLGVKTRNADGSMRSVKDVLYGVADATSEMADGSQKAALVQEIFGKSGAALIPTLNEGSDGLRKMGEMADKLGLSMSKEATEAADSFNDTVELLGLGLSGVARQTMAQLLPTLSGLAGVFLDTATSGTTLKTVADGIAVVLKGLVSIGVVVGTSLMEVGKSLGAVAAAVVAALSGDFSGAMNIVKTRVGDFKDGVTGAAGTIEKVWSGAGNSVVAATAKVVTAGKNGAVMTKEQEAAAKKLGEEYAKLMEKISQRTAEVKAETVAGRALTESEKNAIEITKKYTGEKLKEALAANAKLKVAEDEKRATEAATKARAAEMDKFFEDEERRRQVNEGQIKTAREVLESIQFETAAMKMGNTEREIATVLRGLEKQGVVAGTQAYDALAASIRKAIVDRESVKESIDLLKQQTDSAKRMTEEIGQSLTDALMQGGKSAWEYIKGLVRTTVLRPIVEMAAKPIAGMLGGLLGTGNAFAGNGASAAGGLGQLGSLFSSGMSWLTDFGSNMAFKAGDIGNWLMSNTSGSLNSAGGWLMENAGSIGDWSSMIGNGAGYLNAIMAAGQGKWGSALGSGVGTFFGGPIGAAIGSAIGGLADKLFAGGAGTQHTGSTATADSTGAWTTYGQNTGINFLVNANDRNAKLDDTVKQIAGTAAGVLNSLGGLFGGSKFSVSTGFADDTSKDGAFGALKVLMNGSSVLDWESGRTSKWAPKIFSDGEAGTKEYVAAVATSVRDVITSIGLPEWAKKTFDALGGAPTLEQLATAAQQIAQTQQTLVTVGDFFAPLGGVLSRVAGLSGEAKLQLIEFAGGIDALLSKTKAYVQNYYSTDEQMAISAVGIQKALQDAGIATNLGSKDDLRALIEAVPEQTEAGRKQLAALLGIAEAFAPLGDYLKEQGKTLEDLAASAPQSQLINSLTSDSQAQTDIAAQQLGQLEVLTQQTESTTKEVSRLNDTVELLESAMLSVAENTRRMAKVLESADDGDGLRTVAS